VDYPADPDRLRPVLSLLKEVQMSNHNFGIHMNGDSKETMIGAFQEVYDKIEAVKEAMRACCPNMRNYYHLENGEELFKKDQTLFIAQVLHVADLQEWAMQGALCALGDE
jgi:hypothetical protein